MLSLPHVSAPSAVLLLAALASACTAPAPEPEPTPTSPRTLFEDATEGAGLDFVHFNGMTGERYIVEMMGAGGALFDYDGDGDLDLWARQGNHLAATNEDAAAHHDRLYRNDLEQGPLHFTDVSDHIGIVVSDYGMGVAAADYDTDGDVDLYLTNFGPNRLLQNRGDGTFRDVTRESGTDDDRWSVPAVFADFDADGQLDLWIGNYLDFSLANHRVCRRPNSAIDYCGPLSYRAAPDRLLRNRGDGTFEDVTAAAGLATRYGNAMGVLARDFTGDGKLDLFVANDAQDNLLWVNQGGGRFVEDGLLRGVAVNAAGQREGNMGATAGDFDGDGDADIFVTQLAGEGHILLLQDQPGMFRDGTLASGLATPSLPYTGFGTSWIDVDNDGILDLFVANGEVKVIEALERAGDAYPLHQPKQLFLGLGHGTFEEVVDAGPLESSHVSRGSAIGDLDNDGDHDLVVFNNNGPLQLLLNVAGQDRHWLGLVLEDSRGRAPQGARVELERASGATAIAWAGSDGSYAAANDPRVLFGLGGATDVRAIRVEWPGGREETFAVEGIDVYVRLVEGHGTP